mmetsp:Transcript_5878/g.12905  ORF Transcript_5878/g.12905 Transcript_5878/m.12905 type:complete len:113 (+) Transcript_5878:798-1136(+)
MHSMCCVFWGSCPWQVGGSVKNVIAIAAGMCEGLGLGTNAMAALVTRGCAEMRRLVVSLGGESSTVFGLSGVGDTFGTCFGPLSRNRMVGFRLGQVRRWPTAQYSFHIEPQP